MINPLHHTGLIRKVVHDVFKKRIPERYANDIYQAGFLGVMEAVERFDESLGYKFSTYAYWWIRTCVMRAYINCIGIIHIPEYIRVKMSWEEVIRVTVPLRLNYYDPFFNDYHNWEVEIDPGFEAVDSKMMEIWIDSIMEAKLKGRNEAVVIRKRFGFYNKHPMSLEKIGRDLGFTRERARQIENEALCKLSRHIRRLMPWRVRKTKKKEKPNVTQIL